MEQKMKGWGEWKKLFWRSRAKEPQADNFVLNLCDRKKFWQVF